MDSPVLILVVSLIVVIFTMGWKVLFDGYSKVSAGGMMFVIVMLFLIGYLVNWLFAEMAVVGITFVAIGTIVGWIGSVVGGKPIIDEKIWNSDFVMEWSLLITAILGHVLFEISGSNTYYCTEGVACKKLKLG
ncbi:MAG: hypothetical protein KDC67_11455 [Ignavibacteriae bacterium]|nr:hypothetical protein [Ignavibacteriota bacterium]